MKYLLLALIFHFNGKFCICWLGVCVCVFISFFACRMFCLQYLRPEELVGCLLSSFFPRMRYHYNHYFMGDYLRCCCCCFLLPKDLCTIYIKMRARFNMRGECNLPHSYMRKCIQCLLMHANRITQPRDNREQSQLTAAFLRFASFLITLNT